MGVAGDAFVQTLFVDEWHTRTYILVLIETGVPEPGSSGKFRVAAQCLIQTQDLITLEITQLSYCYLRIVLALPSVVYFARLRSAALKSTCLSTNPSGTSTEGYVHSFKNTGFPSTPLFHLRM